MRSIRFSILAFVSISGLLAWEAATLADPNDNSSKETNGMSSKPVISDKLDFVISEMVGLDTERQEKAETIIDNMKISEQQGLKLLEAALKISADKQSLAFGASAKFIRIAAKAGGASYYPKFEQFFYDYDIDARSEIVEVLVNDGSPTALATIGRIIRHSLGKEDFEIFPNAIGVISAKKELAELPFVELIIETSNQNRRTGSSVSQIVLDQVKSHWISIERQWQLRSAVESRITNLAAEIDKIDIKKGNSWRSDDSYRLLSGEMEILVDLYGSMDNSPSIEVLNRVNKLNDPYLRFWAINASLEHQLPVSESDLTYVAIAPESRNMLFDAMQKLSPKIEFPRQFDNQQALAEGNLVNWLTFPTELNAVPDEIEFLRVESSGFFPRRDTYFFKFRTYQPHWAADDGWMLGWAGPYDRGKLDTHGTDTFSEFEKVE